MRAGLGGWLRLIVSGSAPLSNEIKEFMRVTSCAFVVRVTSCAFVVQMIYASEIYTLQLAERKLQVYALKDVVLSSTLSYFLARLLAKQSILFELSVTQLISLNSRLS